MIDLTKVLFCNISWMKYYAGITKDDQPYSGAGYVLKTGDAYEKFNFLQYDDGYQYGFVETKHNSGVTDLANDYKKFNLGNFGDEYKNKDVADNILVIFFARNPNDKKFYIVGYYKHADVLKTRQYAKNNGKEILYNLKCKAEDSVLIDVNKRVPLNLPKDVRLFYQQLFVYPKNSFEKEVCAKIVEKLLKYDINKDVKNLQFTQKSWLVPCNPKYYQIDSALKEMKDGLWYRQNIKDISEGDYLYLYIGSPISAYKYKCVVLKSNIPANQIDIDEDKKYVIENESLNPSSIYMRIKLIHEIDVSLTDVFQTVPNVSVAPQSQRQAVGEYLTLLENAEYEEENKHSLADLDDENTETYYGDISNTPKEPLIRDGVRYYQRNEKVRKQALSISNNKCCIEGCNHELFQGRNKKPYLEVHHIIPINAQDCYPDINLDVPENVVCLCPSCHREIHNGLNAKDKIIELFQLRKEELARIGLTIDTEELLSFYK